MQPAAANRWDVDSAGRAIYYPFGPAFVGYRLADVAAEQHVRQADESYSEQSSKVGKPLAQLLGTLLAGYLIFAFSRHPVLSLAGLYALFAIAVYLDGVLRYSSVRDHLVNADVMPAKAEWRKQFLVIAGAALGILAAFWVVLALYDLQISILATDHQGELRLFPSIAGRLFFAAVLFLVLFSAIARFDVFSARLGRHKATLTLVIVAVLDVGLAGWTMAKFVAPAPTVIISDQSIRCGWRYSYLWREISALDRKSTRYNTYTVMTLRPSIARNLGKLTDRCDIGGLTVDDETVYRTMVAAWQPHANGS
jgi:hypothetical protein